MSCVYMSQRNVHLSVHVCSCTFTVSVRWLHIFRLHWCWWRMLETKCVGDKFEMLVTDSECWWPINYIGKITNITKKVVNILILSPTSKIGHHHLVTKITMSPTSLSPISLYMPEEHKLNVHVSVVLKP